MKFSIITICKNAQKTISRTITSVLAQTYENIEYIVVDGGSSDGTCEIVQNYLDRITRFISEPDTGIYNAMNKGIGLATGDILLFLNAGDMLFNEEVITHVSRLITSCATSDVDVFHGKLFMYYEESGDGYVWKSSPINRFRAFRGSIPHPSTFYTRQAFEKNGVFDETYKISGDYEWVVRGVVQTRLRFKYLPIITAIFYQGGISNHPDHDRRNKAEMRKLICCYYPLKWRIIFSILNRFRKIMGI